MLIFLVSKSCHHCIRAANRSMSLTDSPCYCLQYLSPTTPHQLAEPLRPQLIALCGFQTDSSLLTIRLFLWSFVYDDIRAWGSDCAVGNTSFIFPFLRQGYKLRKILTHSFTPLCWAGRPWYSLTRASVYITKSLLVWKNSQKKCQIVRRFSWNH